MVDIFRCEQSGMGRCNGRGWHIQTYHSPTGIPWAEQECPHYQTQSEAEAASLGDRVLDSYYRHLGRMTGREALQAAKAELRQAAKAEMEMRQAAKKEVG